MRQLSVPLRPKNPEGPLQVLIIGRISTEYQNEENIEASYRFVNDYLSQVYGGPLCVKQLGEQASGMLTDRASIREAEELIAAGGIDLVIAEDLSRIYRNPRHQYDFVQNAVDSGTRVICVGDHLDTADENWEVVMGAASLRHGLHIPDTRRRVRRTALHAFRKGGMVTKVKFGYRKLTKEEAESGRFGPEGLMIAKVSDDTPTIRAMKDCYMRGSSYEAIAQWLNTERIPPGRYVESRKWTGGLVKDLLTDPILSGRRTFRKTICEPIYRTGKHRQRKNPDPESEVYPELAHFTVEEQEELLEAIAERTRELLRSRSFRRGPQSKRHNVPRSRSIWPGQAARCAVCGGLMYYMGKYLKCENALHGGSRSCWNHVQISAQLTREHTLDWLLQFLERFPSFRPTLVDSAWKELQRLSHQREKLRKDPAQQTEKLEKQAANLAQAIAEGGRLEALLDELKRVNESLQKAREKMANSAGEEAQSKLRLSRAQVEAQWKGALTTVSQTSFEFANLMRLVFPEFVVQPVQALDVPLVRARGKLMFWPSGLSDLSAEAESPAEEICLILDLFDPPAHIRHMQRCLAAKQENPKLSLKKIAAALGINHMTVKRAFDYSRLMESEGISDPYREIHECPQQASRWSGYER